MPVVRIYRIMDIKRAVTILWVIAGIVWGVIFGLILIGSRLIELRRR
jgi:hypothetical protein